MTAKAPTPVPEGMTRENRPKPPAGPPPKMTYKERKAQSDLIVARLKGATLYAHPVRGMVYALSDGSYISEQEYRRLVREIILWPFRGKGLL